MHTQNDARNRPAQNEADRDRGHEPRDRFCPILINEPVRKMRQLPRGKSGLSRAQEEARAIKLLGVRTKAVSVVRPPQVIKVKANSFRALQRSHQEGSGICSPR